MYGHLTPRAESRQGPVPPISLTHTGGVANRADGSLTLWAQVLDDLRRRIAEGEFDDRFPGDLELVERYAVSRHTVREAVRRLQAEGLVERHRGQGSFVVQGRIDQSVDTLYSLFLSVEEHGIIQESVVRHLEQRHDEEAATTLRCPGQPLLYLERIRLGDGKPIALDCSWLPLSLARPLLSADFHHTALYEQLAERCGVRLTSGWERIRPVIPDRTQREILQITTHQPAFAIERMGLRDGAPVEWRHSIVRGDRLSFVARWTSDDIRE
jgi:GntR family transcriptional regulator